MPRDLCVIVRRALPRARGTGLINPFVVVLFLNLLELSFDCFCPTPGALFPWCEDACNISNIPSYYSVEKTNNHHQLQQELIILSSSTPCNISTPTSQSYIYVLCCLFYVIFGGTMTWWWNNILGYYTGNCTIAIYLSIYLKFVFQSLNDTKFK